MIYKRKDYKINFVYIYILLFLIFHLNTINTEAVYFDISKECTQDKPCSLGDKNNWIGKIVPTDGDDIIIDYSQETPEPSSPSTKEIINDYNKFKLEPNIYLVGENININISSFNLIGSNSSIPQLILNNGNIRTLYEGTFQISFSILLVNNNNSILIDNQSNLIIKENSNITVTQSSQLKVINNSQFQTDGSIKKIYFLNNSSLVIDETSQAQFHSQLLLGSNCTLIGNNIDFYNGLYSFSNNVLTIGGSTVFYSNSFIKNLKLLSDQISLDSSSSTLVSIQNNLFLQDGTIIKIPENTNFVINGQVNQNNSITNSLNFQLNGGTLKITNPNFLINNLYSNQPIDTLTGTILFQPNLNPSSSSSSEEEEEEENSSSSSSSSPSNNNFYFLNNNLPNVIVESNSNLILHNSRFKSLVESKTSSRETNSISTFNFFGTVMLDTISITTINVIICPDAIVTFIKGGCLSSLNIYGNLTIYSPGILVRPNPIQLLDINAVLQIESSSLHANVTVTSGTLISIGSTTISSINCTGENSFLVFQYSSCLIYKNLITDDKSTITINSKIGYFNNPAITIQSSTPQLYSNLIINFQILKNRPNKSGDISILTFLNNDNNNENNNNNNENQNNHSNNTINNSYSDNSSNSLINFKTIIINDLNNTNGNNNNNNNINNYTYNLTTNENSLSILFTFPSQKQSFPEWATILIVIGSLVCIITLAIVIHTIRQKRKLQNEYNGYTRL